MEASAAAAAETPPTVAILNVNDDVDTTTEEEVPVESRTPPVDEGEVGVVTSLDENDEDVHVTMASTLPTTLIIQSNSNNRYLRLDSENPSIKNTLRFEGDYSFGLETRYQLVPSTATGLFHIRSLHNNKFWVHIGGPNRWITATSTEPEEDRSRANCTLFQPVFPVSNNNRVLRLRHVNTGFYVRLFNGANNFQGVLSLLAKQLPTDRTDEFTILDWKTVVVLPDRIRIKNLDNGNYLMPFTSASDPYLYFRNTADNPTAYDYEVIPSRNGGIQLKSVMRNIYLTEGVNSGLPAQWNYITLRAASPTVHNTNTVFLPTLLSNNRALIRCLRTNNLWSNFHRPAMPAWRNMLTERSNFPDATSYVEIGEPVDSRTISNVRYRVDDARIYNERTTGLITDEVVNRLDVPVTSELNLTDTVTNTTNWSRSVTLTVGVTTSGSAGVPLVAEGRIEISTEVANSWDWGTTTETTVQVGSVRTVDVPPMSRVRGTLMATRLSYDVPFSYTQRDVLKNGTVVIYRKDDGVFTGHNGYGYYFEIGPLPLD